jgi:hypothetical protein
VRQLRADLLVLAFPADTRRLQRAVIVTRYLVYLGSRSTPRQHEKHISKLEPGDLFRVDVVARQAFFAGREEVDELGQGCWCKCDV